VLTLAALALFPLLYFGVNAMSKRVYARSLAVQEQLASISNRTQENLAGIQQVKIYAQEEREIEAFRRQCDVFRTKNLALSRIRGAMVAVIGVFSGLGTVFVLFLGGLHVIDGRITLGDFVAFNAYLGQLAWPTIALGWIVNVFQRASGAMARIDEIFARRSRSRPRNGPGGESGAGRRRHRRAVADVRYEGAADRPALTDVSLTIPKGSRIAVVGGVGSGKSTLAHLLARVYPAPSGTITIGGADLAKLPVERRARRDRVRAPGGVPVLAVAARERRLRPAGRR
jgi:ATP-binding cassette subfamily B protein